MNTQMPILYDYIDFRKYLDDYRKTRVTTDPGFTHCYICHRLGMRKSRSYFNNLIKGRKNVSPETTEKLIDLLEMPAAQANYFRALVNYNQTTQCGEKKYYFDQIISLNNTPRKIIDNSTYSYFTTWYHPIIRELLDTFNFTDNYRELAGRVVPPISVKQARGSVALLEQLQLIERTSDGFLKPNGKVISTSDNVQNDLVNQYQTLSLERAQNTIINRKNSHKTNTMTLSVSKEGLEHILEQMNTMRSSVRSIAHKDEHVGKNVYELILHIHRQSI